MVNGAGDTNLGGDVGFGVAELTEEHGQRRLPRTPQLVASIDELGDPGSGCLGGAVRYDDNRLSFRLLDTDFEAGGDAAVFQRSATCLGAAQVEQDFLDVLAGAQSVLIEVGAGTRIHVVDE